MKTIYTVYQLNEKVNKLGNPYIGMTERTLEMRARNWKSKLKLDYFPVLIPLHTETDGQRCFNWEQNKRVELGWPREKSYRGQKSMRLKAHESNKTKIAVKENLKLATVASLKSEVRKEANKKVGKNNVESGQLQRISSLGGKRAAELGTLKQKRKCIYCGYESLVGHIGRWHNENCKSKPTNDNTL